MKLNSVSILTDGIYPYVLGGMQKHSFYLAKYFAQSKIKVDLYYYVPSDKSKQENSFTAQENEFINHILVEMPKADKYIGHYLRQCLAYSKNIYKLFIARPKTDFIYAQGFTAWAFLEKGSMKSMLPKIAVNFHGLEPLQKAADIKSNLQKYMLKPYLLHNLKHADYVFSLGSNLTKILIKNGVENEKIIQIPIGIEKEWLVDTIVDKNNPIEFLFIGRNERRKGVTELYSAIKKVDPQKANFNFIGPINFNDLNKGNKKPAASSPENIKFHGAIYNQAAIREIVKSCDVLVCPSYSEGMPTVILEAMSCGLITIATNVGATNELISESTGYLIQNPNPKLIVDAIDKIINSSAEKRLELKGNAQNLIKKSFLWEEVIKLTITKIEDLI